MIAHIVNETKPTVVISMEDNTWEEMDSLVRQALTYYFDEREDRPVSVRFTYHGPTGPKNIVAYEMMFCQKEKALKQMGSRKWLRIALRDQIRDVRIWASKVDKTPISSFPPIKRSRTKAASRFVRKELV